MSGTLQHLDPTTLLIGENVRDNATLDPQFVASVREHGVLQPITAVRSDTGIEVRDGQRRTLGAREAKLDAIPVYALDRQATDDKIATAERIAHQIVTNDQRSALTDAQCAKVHSTGAWMKPAPAEGRWRRSARGLGACGTSCVGRVGTARP
jgi:ParB family chromosome partitioning protein